MAGYLFYPPAVAAQDRIWRQTVERWGEEQAAKYIHGLHAHLQRLSETPALWRQLPRPAATTAADVARAFFSRYESHYLFFRALPSGKIGVVSILHERSDLPLRLAEDLARLSNRPPDE